MKLSKRNLFAGSAALAVAAPAIMAGKPATASQRENRFVFAMTNQPGGNEIVAIRRTFNGELEQVSSRTIRLATGGAGFIETAPIDPLGSQNALIRDGRTLFAVNAGSGTVTSIEVFASSFGNRSITSSHGALPVSLAVENDVLYVLNVGAPRPNVAIFKLDRNSGGNRKVGFDFVTTVDLGIPVTNPFNNVMAPGQVLLDARKRNLLVVNAAGAEVLSAPLDNEGVPSAGFTSASVPGVVPFAGANTPFGHTLIAEAGSGSVSSFDSNDGGLSLVTGAVANGQAATCWVIVAGKYAYTSNTNSGTISSYVFERDGTLSLIDGAAGSPGNSPTDLALDETGQILYAIDPTIGGVVGYTINGDGSLTAINRSTGLPTLAGIQGLAAI